MLALFLLSVGVLAYVLVGYPLLLRLVVAIRGARAVRKAPLEPSLSVVISAFNEAAVIRGKLENALVLDYPAGKREIVVISDCSDDGTDQIVAEFAARGVTLVRMPTRGGKTAGLNHTVPLLRGEIVVFSDANAIYEPSALRMLVRNFADPDVGYVTGEARYLQTGQAAADVGERAYWSYEMQMKRLETQLGSMVGGDGAIYAIRRQLWQALPTDAINDFLNPLQIVAAGWRGVYEPEAVCWEETAGTATSEYKRRVRIVSRSVRAVFQARAVLNPFKVGLFAWCLWSHKVLRWMSGVFAAGALVGLAGLVLSAPSAWLVPLAVGAGFGALALATQPGRRLLSTVGYFGVVNVASLVGIWRGARGRVSAVWSTPRATGSPAPPPTVAIGRVFLWMLSAGTAMLVLLPWLGGRSVAHGFFWASLAALAYVYAGYPLVLVVWRSIAARPTRKGPIAPSVTLLIAANDEEAVIEAKLRNALSLDYPADRLEVVVVSDGSVDRTNEIVRGFAERVRLIEPAQRQGKMAALNLGMEEVTSEVVVFSDANTFLDPGAVRALVANFSDPTVGCVSGDVALVGERAELGASEDLYYVYERWVQRAESAIGSMIGADGALYAIRRQLYRPQPAETILDDMAIPMEVIRQGYRVVFEPGARASEQGLETAREEFGRKARVVAGAVQFLKGQASDVPSHDRQVAFSLLSHKAFRWLSPMFATTLFLSSVTLAVNSSRFAALSQAQGLLVVTGVLGCATRLRRLPPVALAHYFLLVQAAAAVGVVRGLLGRQSVLWLRFERLRSTSVGSTHSGRAQV